MTTKDALHQIIDGLSETEAERLLDWLNLQADPDELTEEEVSEFARALREMRAGDYVTLEELEAGLG